MRLDRAWMERHIPHQGRMCLLDEVMEWDHERIRCRSATHRDADHPLRAHGRLGVAAGVEYAAQAMAIHGALIAGASAAAEPGTRGRQIGAPAFGTPDAGLPRAGPPRAGLLAGVRGLQFGTLRLDDVESDLICTAVRIAGDGGSALYEFELASLAAWLLRGRATVIFDATGMALGPAEIQSS